MMTKETDTRLSLCQKQIQTRRFANVTGTPTMALEAYAGGRIVRQHDVYAVYVQKPFNLI